MSNPTTAIKTACEYALAAAKELPSCDIEPLVTWTRQQGTRVFHVKVVFTKANRTRHFRYTLDALQAMQNDDPVTIETGDSNDATGEVFATEDGSEGNVTSHITEGARDARDRAIADAEIARQKAEAKAQREADKKAKEKAGKKTTEAEAAEERRADAQRLADEEEEAADLAQAEADEAAEQAAAADGPEIDWDENDA